MRRTPEIVAAHPDEIDVFCVGDEAVPDRLRDEGYSIVLLRDGWYQGDGEGDEQEVFRIHGLVAGGW